MNLQSVYYRSLTVRKSEGSDIARENIGGERFCAYHFASSALCGIYFWHFMHILDRLKFMKKSPLFFSTVGWICFGIWYKFFNCRIWRCGFCKIESDGETKHLLILEELRELELGEIWRWGEKEEGGAWRRRESGDCDQRPSPDSNHPSEHTHPPDISRQEISQCISKRYNSIVPPFKNIYQAQIVKIYKIPSRCWIFMMFWLHTKAIFFMCM